MSREVPVALPLTHEHDVSEPLAAIAAVGGVRRTLVHALCTLLFVHVLLPACSLRLAVGLR